VFGSEIKKSSTNNISEELIDNGYSIVNQILNDIETGRCNPEYNLQDSHLNQVWNYFRSRFVEIPASGGLVRNPEGLFLFIRRLGYWDLPKGKIEKRESAEIAAVREVGEECGLSVLKVSLQLDSTYHIYRSPYLNYPENLVLKETKWFLMDYSGNEVPVPQTEEDIEEIRWVSVADFDFIYQNTYPSLRDLLEKTLPDI
jgi:8-oxo-dGTP pyrophosphatase MutT (NUDIX family)